MPIVFTPLHQHIGEIGESANLKAKQESQTQAVLFDCGNELESQRTNEQNENDKSESSHFRFLPSFTVSKV